MNLTSLIFGPVAFLVHLYSDLYLQQDIKNAYSDNFILPRVDTYDFIVVGAGTAGCVVANRLSTNYTVLLIEAGGEPPPQTYVPAFAPQYKDFQNIIYSYKTVPMNNFALLTGGVIDLQVGKVLGGTGVLNNMFYNRGSPHDYDNWAHLLADSSWNYKNVLQYFKTTENYTGGYPSDQHGKDGLLPISSQKYSPGLQPWLKAAAELGFKTGSDPSGPQTIGFTAADFNKRMGRRVTTYDAFIKPFAETRKNLTVLRYAHVDSILLDDKNSAYGVSYSRHAVPHLAHASKEVILSAGTYGSPQILLRSGIGPADQLYEARIPAKVDLPVGKNLHDHIKLRLEIAVTNRTVCENTFTEKDIDDFYQKGEGPLTSTSDSPDPTHLSLIAGQGFISSSRAYHEGYPDWSDVQISLYSQQFIQEENNSSSSNAFSESKKRKKCANKNGVIYPILYLTRPRSRGSLKLNLSNVHGPPDIDLNYLNDLTDVGVLVDGIKQTLAIFETTETYRSIGASYPLIFEPGCKYYSFRSDAYWECYIRHRGESGNHPAGTCVMGTGPDDESVVDSNLRVFGVKKLRVIDASVMPAVTNTDLQAAVVLIAEKASADILDEWKVRLFTYC